MKALPLIIVFRLCAVLLVTVAAGCGSMAGTRVCSDGMCSGKGVALAPEEVRERASTFAYNRLVERQKSSAPVTGSDGRPIAIHKIDPEVWLVSGTMTTGWQLKRHLTRDLWQVVECKADGSDAENHFEVEPVR